MLSEMVGPWRRVDYDKFVELGTDVKPIKSLPTTLGGLMQMYTPPNPSVLKEQEAQLVQKAWNVRKAHPIYLWLQSSPIFAELWRLFEKQRSQAASEDKVALPNAPFVMLKIIVEWAGVSFDVAEFERRASGQKRTDRATKPRRKAAVRHADALIKLLNQGVHMQGIENYQLKRLLAQFREEVNNINRKPREGKGSTSRGILEIAAFQMVANLGLSSPSILANLAAFVDTPCDYKTAQRIFRRAEKKYRDLLAQGLRVLPGQITPQS
jgi:hypothetical protein